ncbi:SDR family NAD(P)-dependent oxidoreductase [Gloeocapsopsis crepidinum LEGE 06123]|uniref:SDR family NAD(P)-dependent oxidoreductase n=1 Tax=Gloeocapsopsis crepidinum LEGE 06123 TaxID=588587 RepID=A0ABR9UN59_9CHRO|nr:SDR family NAD(P)-dependent oxidoreductase [Gloeocapsopsis crepidinum]MBE9189732.1 SDR family NAD(P)-dependent oxidoreductase [Gloeocapsopsis crepidinum LEGE 06123]
MKSQVDSNSVFLVSGGAKGITAQCVIELAKEKQCKFILLGRSSPSPEPVWAMGCNDEAVLKKRIMEYLVASGEKPTPVMVQKQYKAIASSREIQATLNAIEQAGSKAEYFSVDVTDTEALQAIADRLTAVTGIIHGAGNLADKRIEKKTSEDFDTVYAAKVTGLANLLRYIPASQLQQLVLFSSVAGFYGNVGQADYAIANEILNKLAHLVKYHHPDCHVVAINWGPWDSGMVSPELKKAFAERNIETIPIQVGAKMLVEELESTHQETQVIVGSPLVFSESFSSQLQTFRIQRHLTVDANPFLQDHVIANRPVLPATCAIAWIANTCEQLYPGYQFSNCRNYKVLKGIIFEPTTPIEYTLELQETNKNNIGVEFDAKIWSKNLEGKTRYHFSTQLTLKRQIPSSPDYASIKLNLDQSYSNQLSFYQDGTASLFHGMSFQGVKQVLNITPEKVTIECLLPSLNEQQQGQFPVQTFNPYIVDVQIHSLWIWSQYFHQQGCLPSAINLYEQFIPVSFDETFYVSCEVKSKTDSAVIAEVITHNSKGKVYSRMTEAKGTLLPTNKNN